MGGETNPCNSCREAKAKKEAIPKNRDQAINILPKQFIWLDMSTLRKSKTCGSVKKITNPNWRLMVDDFTDLPFSVDYGSKNGMVEATCE